MIELIIRALSSFGFFIVLVSFSDQNEDFWTWVGTPGWGPMLFKLWLFWIALVLLWKLARLAMRLTASRTFGDDGGVMNVRRGFFRIWIGVSVLWVMLMGFTIVAMDFEVFGKNSRPANLSDNIRALAATIGIPLVLLVIGLGVGWIASGFRKQSPKTPLIR